MYDTTKPYTNFIIETISKTWNKPSNKIYHVDGIGTKGIYHWQNRSFKNAVIDSLAMNLNDLAFNYASPKIIADHITIPEDDEESIKDIIVNLTKECEHRNIEILGGETSIHNNLNGMDISITMIGDILFRKNNKFLPNDIIIGIESNGLHCNGFTKIRELGMEYSDEFIKPTRIYIDDIMKLIYKYDIHAMMHMTGGGFTKLLKLNDNTLVNIAYVICNQNIFYDIYNCDVSDYEMYKTFNCGIGFIIALDEEYVDDCMKDINHRCSIIGDVCKGNNKVIINSSYSNNKVEY